MGTHLPLLHIMHLPLLHTTPQFTLRDTRSQLMMPHQYMVLNTLLLMTTAKLNSAQMRLVMVIRQQDHTVLPFPMDAHRLSTTMSMMLMVGMLLMSLMKDMPHILQHLFTNQLINQHQLQFTTQPQSSLSMPKSSLYLY